MKIVIVAVFATFALAGCGGSKSAPPPASGEPAAAPAASSPGAEQVAQGGALFGKHCAACHGNAGQGTEKAPPVVGAEAFPLDPRPGAKRNVQFHTALDVFMWAKANMPGDAPGTLPDDQLLAIFAFDLTANGVDLKGQMLDGEIAKGVVLHP